MNEENVADELAIRNLVARYADAVTRRDTDAWGATWADQGVWQIMGQTLAGRAELVAFWQQTMSGFDFVLQLPSSGSVEIEGDSGSGRWYVSEHVAPSGGGALLNLGVYDDRYCREHGSWRFSERRFHAFYLGSPDLSDGFTPNPEERA